MLTVGPFDEASMRDRRAMARRFCVQFACKMISRRCLESDHNGRPAHGWRPQVHSFRRG